MRFFPFEFFRSRFRRKSLKKLGNVNEEPLHILPSNGGRTDGVLFEFQGEIDRHKRIEIQLNNHIKQLNDEIVKLSQGPPLTSREETPNLIEAGRPATAPTTAQPANTLTSGREGARQEKGQRE